MEMKININENQFNRLILERHFSDVIYHFTPLYNLPEILEDNMLTYSYDYDNYDKYFISVTTTRSAQYGYPYFNYARRGTQSFARITLDGRKLNYNHTGNRYQFYYTDALESSLKGRPKNFKPDMSYDEYKKKNNGNGIGYESNFNLDAQHMEDYESEDRIIMNKHEKEGIKPIKPYILRIDIFLCGNNFNDTDYLYEVKENFDNSKIFIYDNLKYFDMQSTKHSYSIDDVLKTANL